MRQGVRASDEQDEQPLSKGSLTYFVWRPTVRPDSEDEGDDDYTTDKCIISHSLDKHNNDNLQICKKHVTR